MTVEKKYLKAASNIAGTTKLHFYFNVIAHIVVASYMFANYFYDVDWDVDIVVFMVAGVFPIYYVVIMRKLVVSIIGDNKT